jgi:hypothetical protein
MSMDAESLARSATTDSAPPAGISEELKVLWLARAGRWDAAHDACQDLPDPAGAWIHAWLHRQEGDYGNACYWYARAGKPAPARTAPLEDEWMEIAAAFAQSR